MRGGGGENISDGVARAGVTGVIWGGGRGADGSRVRIFDLGRTTFSTFVTGEWVLFCEVYHRGMST